MSNDNTAAAIVRKQTFKPLVRLFITYTALYAFRSCYMRLCFWTLDNTGIEDPVNLIFVLISLAAVAGLVAAPLLLDRTKLGASPAGISFTVHACIALSAASAIASCLASGYVVLALQFATSLFATGAIAVCLRRLVSNVSTMRGIGLFVGISSAATMLCVILLFFSPFGEIPEWMIPFIICGLLAVAAVSFGKGSERSEADTEQPALTAKQWQLTPRILRLAFLVMCLYVIICGVLDNFYFFEESFDAMPTVPSFYFFFLHAIVFFVVAGYAVGRVSTAAAVICGFAMICVGQSMAYFNEHDLLVYPYEFFSASGDIVLEVFLVSLPIAYCVLFKRKPGILPGLGFILLCGSYALTSILFEFVPEDYYMAALGVMLLLSIAAIIAVTYLMNEDKNNRLRHIEEDFSRRLADALKSTEEMPPIEGLIVSYGFTNREAEALRYLIEGRSTDEIAAAMTITRKSAYNYINALLSKTGMKSRNEIIARFNRANR